MGEVQLILAAWLLVLVSVLAWRTRVKRRVRHFPYEPRAALIRRALEEKLAVRFVYWSQAERGWLHRTVEPEELKDGHLRARDHRTDRVRKYEVTRMRKVRVGGRCVRAPLAWQAPFSVLAGLVALALSAKAVWDTCEREPANTHNAQEPPVHWLHELPPPAAPAAPAREADAEPAVALTQSVTVAETVEGPPRSHSLLTQVDNRWGVLVKGDGGLPNKEVRNILGLVFMFAPSQALYWGRHIELGSQPIVWRGDYEAATNYVSQLQKYGLPAELKEPKLTRP